MEDKARRNAENHIYTALVENKEEVTKILQTNTGLSDDELKGLLQAVVETTDDISKEVNKKNFFQWIRNQTCEVVVGAFYAVLGSVGAGMASGYYWVCYL